MSVVRLFLPLLIITVALSAHAATDLKVDAIYPCDENGNAIQPKVGDKFHYLRVDWSYQNGTSQVYQVRATLADVPVEFDAVTPGNGSYWYIYTFWAGIDGSVPIKGEADPHNVINDPNRLNNVKNSAFTPSPPISAIEYFDPIRYRATQSTKVLFSAGTWLDRVVLFGYHPLSETHQTVISHRFLPSTGHLISSEPYGHPMWLSDTGGEPARTIGFDQTTMVQLRRSRVNADLLRNCTWAAVDAAAAQIPAFVAAEDWIQKDDPEIQAFFARHLPANYRSTYTPYDAAKKLYLAVKEELDYDLFGNWSGLESLQYGRGDCGGMTCLYLAALRIAGIPCRAISGWWEGIDDWHVKSEFLLPGYGWVGEDVSIDESISPSGQYAFLFGTDVFLNTFFAINRATTHRWDVFEIGNAFQPGTMWWYGDVVLDHWEMHCRLQRLITVGR